MAEQIIQLLQSHDYPSHDNSINVVVVKQFVRGYSSFRDRGATLAALAMS